MTAVTQDASSLRYVPASTAEWQTLLSGTGLNAPSSIWLCQEASGSLADSGSAGRTITVSGTPAYRAAATGWSRTGIKPADASATDYGTATIPDVATTSFLLLQMFSLNTVAPALRGFNRIGSGLASSHFPFLTAGNKIVTIADANSAGGQVTQAGTFIIITKLDRSRLEFAAYTQNEKLAPTWSAPAANTTLTLFGNASGALDATMVYAALWTGTDAEMSDAQVQALLDSLEGNMTTRDKLFAGSTSTKTVVAIDGCEYLLSDAPGDAVRAAWHGYDWIQVLNGLFVNIQNEQSIDRDSAFTTSGRCTIRVLDQTREDTLGKLMHRKLAGSATQITATVDRNDTTITVASTANFPSSGTAYIGNECFTYTGTTATTFTGCTRGKYSPFGCAISGSGGNRFAGHHRVGADSNNVQLQPLVTSLPRNWNGKRVGVWLHTWDDRNQTLNHRREAQLVYAGRIVQVGDDAHTFCTTIELEHLSNDLQNAWIGRNQWSATVADGMYIPAGRTFKFNEGINGTVSSYATDLVATVGASGTNQFEPGYYMGGELCTIISAWLAGEKTAARINGFYNLQSPVSSNVGPRTKMYWRRESGSAGIAAHWALEVPGEVAAFLGLLTGEPGTLGQSVVWSDLKKVNEDNRTEGELAPFHSLIFKPQGPGRISQEFNEASSYEIENEQGAFIDQYSLLPYAVKPNCDSTKPWGLFILDERAIVVGSLTSGVLGNCWLAPFQLTADSETAASVYIGRRVDEPERGPVTLRQYICMEETWKVIVKSILYSTGTPGYNHSTFDSLSYSLSAGMPGGVLGDEFERSLDNMPGADVPAVIVIDEPTRLSDLLTGDLILRRSFFRWKDQHFEIVQWRTPHTDNAIADLTEDTKASADDNPQFRCSSVVTHNMARPTTKFDYSRDFGSSRGETFQRSFAIEDQTQVDDLGGAVQLQTVKLRNTFTGTSSVGAGLQAMFSEYLAGVTIFRPSLAIDRLLDQRYYLELAPGDTVAVTDLHARDPLSGERGTTERAAMVVSHGYTMGGFTPNGKENQAGRIGLNFLDVQRGQAYAPAAEIDSTANSGGFSAGYNSGTNTIRCLRNAYSQSGLVVTRRGRRQIVEEGADANYLDAGDKALVIQIDPADPALPIYWERTILSQSGDDITFTTGLSAPAWDATKKYRVVPQKWSQVLTSQHDWAYQADKTDHRIEDDGVAFHYSASEEPLTYATATGTELGELLPNMCYGDGRPYDAGHERGLINTINAFYDRKSAHQGSFLWNRTARANLITWNALFVGQIYLGREMLASRITRTLTVAPFWRSATGAASSLRVTISRLKPQALASVDPTRYGADAFINPKFTGEFSQSTTWTTSSTTWQTGADFALDAGVKDPDTGNVWLVIEGGGEAECRGLAKIIEGIRQVG
jgi:hypothetical protein